MAAAFLLLGLVPAVAAAVVTGSRSSGDTSLGRPLAGHLVPEKASHAKAVHEMAMRENLNDEVVPMLKTRAQDHVVRGRGFYEEAVPAVQSGQMGTLIAAADETLEDEGLAPGLGCSLGHFDAVQKEEELGDLCSQPSFVSI